MYQGIFILHIIALISASEFKEDVNLMSAVGSPLPSDVRAVVGPFGRKDRPAIEFSRVSYIGRYARDMFNFPFPKDFSIKVSTYSYTIDGGVLFSIVSKDQRRDMLVLEIVRKNKRTQTIMLTYKNVDPAETYVLKFDVPRFDRRWTVFSLSARDQDLWLFMNGCQLVKKLKLVKNRDRLKIENDAVVYVGRAGWYSHKSPFFVSIKFIWLLIKG